MTSATDSQRSSRPFSRSEKIALLLILVVPTAFILWIAFATGRPIMGAPLNEQVIRRAFPAEIKAADNMDDHGWLYVEVRTSFDGNPQQLCEQFVAAIYRQIHWAIPGVGLAVYPDSDALPGPHNALARCSTFPFGLGNKEEGR